VLHTVRADHLRTHAGEVAFAGGMSDSTDLNPVHTAIRETCEEVGIPGWAGVLVHSYRTHCFSSSLRIVASLPPFRSRFNYAVYPIVAIANGDHIKPMPNRQSSDYGHGRTGYRHIFIEVLRNIFTNPQNPTSTMKKCLWHISSNYVDFCPPTVTFSAK
jgi:hypothetical protein